MMLRKRTAIYMVIGFVGAALIIVVVKAFDTNLINENLAAVIGIISTITMGLIGISHKLLEGEDDGKPGKGSKGK